MKKLVVISIALVLITTIYLFCSQSPVAAQEKNSQPAGMVDLGRRLFFDGNLSVNGTQSCASCHAPEVGYTGPDALTNASSVVYLGALEDRYGNRKPPASAYAGDSPA